MRSTILLLAVAAAAASEIEECRWRHNITDVTKLEQHKYVVLETCILYMLTDENEKLTGMHNSLKYMAPIHRDADIVPVHVEKTVVRQVHADHDDSLSDMYVELYLYVKWNDNRLQWQPTKWHGVEKIRVHLFTDIWTPDVTNEDEETFSFFDEVEVTFHGDVTARVELAVETKCEVDFTDFPNDQHLCCLRLKPHTFEDAVRFVKDDKAIAKVDMNTVTSTIWDIEGIDTAVKQDDRMTVLQMCVVLRRLAGALNIQMTVPLSLTCIIVIFAPLFGDIRIQNYVKLFSLLLQFLCFKLLADKTPMLGFGDTIPKIYRFYEFSFTMTFVSLIVGLTLAALGRMERKMPPPHSLYLFASALNLRMCCPAESPRSAVYSVENPQSPPPPADAPTNYARDWAEIYTAVNNLLSLLILFVFVIGMLVLLP